MAFRIVGVSCSPRKEQSTHFALSAALDAVRKEVPEAETVLIDLAGKDIRACTACGKCMKELACSQEDDFPELIPTLADPDVAGMILATPVYFGSMTGQAKSFLDRCCMFRRNGCLFRNRVGGVVTVGGFRHGGQETAISAVHCAMLIQDMIVVGDGFSTFHFGGTMWSGCPDGFKKDEFGLKTCENLGRRVAEVARKMRS